MQYIKLNDKGAAHLIAGAFVVALIAVAGVKVVISSFADSQTNISTSPRAEHVSYAPKGPPPQLMHNSFIQKPSITDNGGACFYGACYYYVSGNMGTTSALGASASITQAQPIVNPKDYHSLTELAVTGGGPAGPNTVEIGWTVDRTVNGDSLPHLFVYHWVNGAATCYNGCGFVPASTKYRAGGPVTTGVYGTYSIKYDAAYKGGAWLLGYDDNSFNYVHTLLGYFPESIWGGSFTSIGTVSAFGEVASSSYYTPETQMGSGNARTAFIRNLTFLDIKPGSVTTTMGISNTEAPSLYTGQQISNFSFGYGGPGSPQSNNPYVNLAIPTIQNLSATVTGSIILIPGDTISSMYWNWGDGTNVATYPVTGSVPFSESHTYNKAGTYTINVEARDNRGYTTMSSEKVIIP